MSSISPSTAAFQTLDQIIQQADIFDVVVIGTGLAGLAAGLTLAQKGVKILMIEVNDQVGGYAVNFYRKGYRMESALQSVSGAEKGGTFHQILHQLKLESQFRFLRIPFLKSSLNLADSNAYVYSAELSQFIEGLVQRYPAEVIQIHKFMRKGFSMGKFLANWNISPWYMKIVLSCRYLYRIPLLLRYFTKSTGDLLDDFFESAELKEELFSYANFFGANRYELSAIVYFAAIFAKFAQGDYYIEGGSGVLTTSMAHQIESLGGVILFNHRVVSMAATRHRIKSIVIEPVRGSHARKTFPVKNVLYCGDPHRLFNQICLPNTFPKKYMRLFDSRKQSESIFAVYLGLDLDVRDLGLNNYCYEVKIPNGNNLLMFIYSNLDPSCCPPGCSNILLIRFMNITKFESAMKLDGGKRGIHYNALKYSIRDDMIDTVGNLIGPDLLKSHIKVREAASPVTFHRYTSNTRGSFVGFLASFDQSIIHRIPHRSPLRNLYLAGQWVNLGGGFQYSIYGGIVCASQLYEARLKWHQIQTLLFSSIKNNFLH